MADGLKLSNISKRFGEVQALRNISLEFAPGEVHAVLGENGAGKSTLVNVVAGLTSQDSGAVMLNGVELPRGDAVAARRAGLGVVHQHFTLVPSFTVAENIALFRMRAEGGRFDVKRFAEPAIRKAHELSWSVDPQARIAGLPVGAQQRVEILKGLCDNESILLFDEPTAPLAGDEVKDLLRILRKLASEGRVVVLIAHKLNEVLAVADRVSVLRRGELQAQGLAARDVNAAQLAHLMVGDLPQETPRLLKMFGDGGLEVTDLTVRANSGAVAVRGVSFGATRGQIFGIGGVDGNGQLELAEALVGIRPFQGSVRFDGETPGNAAYIPADRQSDGLALGMSVAENLLLGRLRAWPKRRETTPWMLDLVSRYDVKVTSLEQGVSELSGGNQQKLVVARVLDRDPAFVVAVNPARGLDVRAAAFVHAQLRQARDNGAAVVLVSADLDELYAVADRVSFMRSGQLGEATSATALVDETR
ncbi:MAG: ABC transporter ATP-binding protein [Fimbriimonadaceae bacterium]